MLCWKTISSAGVDFAVQENDFQHWSRLCGTGKSFPAPELTVLYGKIISDTGIDCAVLENDFQRGVGKSYGPGGPPPRMKE